MLFSPPLQIVLLDRIDGHAIIVTYSDNRTAVYSTEQLLTLTPTQVMTEEEALTHED